MIGIINGYQVAHRATMFDVLSLVDKGVRTCIRYEY